MKRGKQGARLHSLIIHTVIIPIIKRSLASFMGVKESSDFTCSGNGFLEIFGKGSVF
jgi:hypothetical protein